MYTRKRKQSVRCPIERGLNILGGRWKSRIICVLAKKKLLRYNELRREMANVSDTVLAAALKELLADGIVQRRQYDEIPPRVEYSLTERGKSCVPILQAVAQWAGGSVPKDDGSPEAALCIQCNYIDLP